VRQNLGRLACGDRVVWRAFDTGEGVVVAVGERHTLLARPDYNGQLRPIAANLDAVAVVLAPTPEPSEYLIDRYLVAIAAIGARGLLVLNKIDLLDRSGLAALAERLEPYRRIGYPLLLASGHAAHGLNELRAWLRGRTSLLAGQSGVGKSSLIKALLPDREIRIQAVSAATGHGTHTTSASTLYHLPDGGDLIDTPGVRSFELGEIGSSNWEKSARTIWIADSRNWRPILAAAGFPTVATKPSQTVRCERRQSAAKSPRAGWTATGNCGPCCKRRRNWAESSCPPFCSRAFCWA